MSSTASSSVGRPGRGQSFNLTDELPPDRPIDPVQARRLAAACMQEPDGAMLVNMIGIGEYA